MTSQEKAVLAATTSCIGIGLIVTLFVWSRLNFDLSQMAQVWTLVALCFVLAGGYFACEVYVAIALWMYDPSKWD